MVYLIIQIFLLKNRKQKLHIYVKHEECVHCHSALYDARTFVSCFLCNIITDMDSAVTDSLASSYMRCIYGKDVASGCISKCGVFAFAPECVIIVKHMFFIISSSWSCGIAAW